ncbi:MAG: phosphoribosylformylglycinamidine synthase subunit PurL [Actinomycetota bacterium]|nr:phosphoribosylformylglycinamidine synthase subunit PurL [Actinomycetota bacterium]MDG2120469.1 phosphoribosylformylglycinamidine synthase subunit PurL [Actinomycetota bacterium]
MSESLQNPLIYRALGLSDEEYNRIENLLGRIPNHLELAMYSVMWSEHCSYKSSKVHLKRLPTEAPWVLVGPGENAGVIDVGDGIAVAIRIESHNHPSAIEPYQGAATGVGGILRDIFTMGARPIAVMDPLRFGPLDDPHSRWIAEGVISGVSGYGNSVGVPTVGGEIVFDETYRGNPLVNVLAMGVLPAERLVLGQASGVGNLAVLLGSATGRDGIGGVSVLASAGFDEHSNSSDKRPSVQVGDPFEEKRLLEACLELLEAGLAVGIQDLGGAGLTCATSETASRGGAGMDVDITAVSLREVDMEPFEIMTSESQERMLVIVEPCNLAKVLEISDRWEVIADVVGKVTGDGQLKIRDGFDGPVIADIPAATLHDDAPEYERPLERPIDWFERQRVDAGLAKNSDSKSDLLFMLRDSSWVYRQYDHQLFLNTVVGPGDDGTLLRLRDPRTGRETGRGLGMSTDGNHRWCYVDPRAGTKMLVAEAVMNIACVGANPMAIVNCLNFGNPEHPVVMWQMSEAIDGMAEACIAFSVPIVGGNVSLYNETNGVDIAPTPVVGVIGMHPSLNTPPPGMGIRNGLTIIVLGQVVGKNVAMGGSRWAWDIADCRDGCLPEFDLDQAVKTASFVAGLVQKNSVSAVHDVGEGGLAVALSEMAIRGGTGMIIDGLSDHRLLFNETGGRVVIGVETEKVNDLLEEANAADIPAKTLGFSGGMKFIVGEVIDIGLDELTEAWRTELPDALGQGTVSA